MSRERAIVKIELDEAERRLQLAQAEPSNHFRPARDLEQRLAPLKAEAARLAKELAQFNDRAEEAELAERRAEHEEVRKDEKAEAAFWFRRFFTTLGIANGAAFAALASGLLQADNPERIAPLVGPAMDQFIWGALAAGSIPFWLWARLILQGWMRDHPTPSVERAAWKVLAPVVRQLVFFSATLSVWSFCFGLFLAAGAVNGMATAQRAADAAHEASLVK